MRVRRVVVAALAVAVWSVPAAGQGLSAAIPKRFIADAPNRTMKVYPGSGLSTQFTRNLITIDPDGTQAPANQMRVDALAHLAAVPSEYTLVNGAGGELREQGVQGARQRRGGYQHARLRRRQADLAP